jgi:hypothetical protein
MLKGNLTKQMGDKEIVENRSISFTVNLNEKDLIRFNFWVVYRRWNFPIITASMFLLGCFDVATGVMKGFSHVPGSLIFPFGFLVVFPVFLYLGAKKSFRNRLYQEEKTYQVDFESIKTNSESVQSIHRWEDFKDVRFTSKAIYMFLTTNSALIFPNDSIPASSLPSLKSLICEKVPKKKRNRFLRITAVILIAFLVFTGTISYFTKL